MSFFNLSDNANAADTGAEFEMGGNMEPIPNNTDVLAAPDEAKWEYPETGMSQIDPFISLRWVVLAPKEYANRKVFQKIRVEDKDSKKSDKAKRMLAAIDTNAGGRLLAAGERPSDNTLAAALINKPMVLKLMVWSMIKEDGTTATGNWVSAVSPRNKPIEAQKPTAKTPVVGIDDDIPF